LDLNLEVQGPKFSVRRFKTFYPAVSDKNLLMARLCANIESAASFLRRHKITAMEAVFCLKTQQFQYQSAKVGFSRATALSGEISKAARLCFEQIYRPGVLYRATGVVLSKFEDDVSTQLNLFENPNFFIKLEKLFRNVDLINERYGRDSAVVCSSLLESSRRGDRYRGCRGRGERFLPRFKIPALG